MMKLEIRDTSIKYSKAKMKEMRKKEQLQSWTKGLRKFKSISNFKRYSDTSTTQKCEGLLTEKECLEVVKLMESGKSPGTDGLHAEFYKVFGTTSLPT